ncbi:MAG: metallophosphatase domain-containing protein [Bacteriovoracaceae bacterium]
MKLTFISDTHSCHEIIKMEDGDILFHCGDMTKRGELREVSEVASYLASQPFKYKVVIAGNHDFCFENENRKEAEKILTDQGIIYLNDSLCIIDGLKIWGSPIQPFFHNWAFNKERGNDIKRHWDLIPDDIHILLTHGPPFGILDSVQTGESVGCEELLKKVEKLRPKIHAFGHIHESYGLKTVGDTIFVNASVLDINYRIKNIPLSLQI